MRANWLAGSEAGYGEVVVGPGFGFLSQNKAHRAKRTQLMRIDDDATLLDAKFLTHALQHVAIGPDIFPHAFVATESVADEIGGHGHEVAVRAHDTDV